VNDCVAPTVCDANGKCGPPPADTGSGGGCGVAARVAPDQPSGLAWVALCLGMLGRRRRARRGERGLNP
jgi:hypothetical protein